MLKNGLFSLLIAACCLFMTLPVSGVENKGAEEITLSSGNRGDVSFPHRKHQDKLKDCQICHVLFPQTAGSIKTEKAEGRLASKQVMNKLCIKCHREKRQAGEPSGPTSCNTCHHQE